MGSAEYAQVTHQPTPGVAPPVPCKANDHLPRQARVKPREEKGFEQNVLCVFALSQTMLSKPGVEQPVLSKDSETVRQTDSPPCLFPIVLMPATAKCRTMQAPLSDPFCVICAGGAEPERQREL